MRTGTRQLGGALSVLAIAALRLAFSIRDADITGRVDYGPGTMPVERSLYRARLGNIKFCPARNVSLESA